MVNLQGHRHRGLRLLLKIYAVHYHGFVRALTPRKPNRGVPGKAILNALNRPTGLVGKGNGKLPIGRLYNLVRSSSFLVPLFTTGHSSTMVYSSLWAFSALLPVFNALTQTNGLVFEPVCPAFV